MERLLSLEDIKFQYLMRKMPTSKAEIPAPGYYHILANLPSDYQGNESCKNGYLFSASYHPFEPDFNIEFRVPALLWSLYNNCSIGPKEYMLEDFIGAIIHIKELTPASERFVSELGEVKESTSYRVIWDLIDYLPINNDSDTPDQELTTITNKVELDEISHNKELADSDSEELIDNLGQIDDELDEIFHEANLVDWELEEIFWEANQPDWCINQSEIEFLLDKYDSDSLLDKMEIQ